MTLPRRVLVLGCGAVGAAVARRLRAAGVHVVGTTTRAERADEVAASCDEVAVLRGGDVDDVRAAVARVDAIVVCVSPPEGRSVTVEGRLATYQAALVDTARSVVAAAGGRHVLAISSLSVLGGAEHLVAADEGTPLPDLDDPSPRAYREMERTYLDGLPTQVTILRAGDIVSPGDPSLEDKVRLAHQYLGGSVPFDDRALAYRVRAEDVGEVVATALEQGPQHVVHVVTEGVPPTNAELFGAACRRAGLEPLTFRRELATPRVPVTSRGLERLGVRLAPIATGSLG